jgi:tetratricopeptide (TPR) repeat protein
MVQLFEVDYRVREMIFTSLTIRHEEISLDPQQARLTDSLSLEIAKCFWLGFGTKRNEALARTWLSKTSLNSEFDSHIAGIKTALHSNYLWWTKLTQLMSIGHIQFTNDMQYYRDQKQTREILAIERRELEDWNEALGPAHFIVSQRGAMLFEKLANLGMRNEALHLLQNMYEECNSALPSDHPRIKNLLAILAKAHLMNDEKTASRKFLFTLYPELQNPADRADIIGKQSDAAFLNHASNYALLAATEDAMHNYKEAESLYKLILPRMCRLLGTQNLQCIKTQYNLGMVYHNQGQYTEAWQLFDPLYRITVSSVGETHEMSLLIAEKRVELQARLRLHRTWVGRWVNRQIQLGFEKAPIETSQITLGNSHPYTIEAINRGVEALAGATRYDEAVKLAKCAVEIVEKRSGKESHDAETQRKKLAGVRRTASLHWAFFRWGSWTLGPNEPKRIRGVIVGWKRRVFEPFELDFSLDPNYQIEN